MAGDAGQEAVFYIQALGETAFYYGNQKVQLRCKMTSRYIELLLFLLFGEEFRTGMAGQNRRRGGVKRERILEALYGHEDAVNAGNAMRINMSRLRKLLAEAGIPGSKYIQTEDDTYFLELDCAVRADVWEFEELIYAAEQARTQEERLECLKRACYLYKGTFLPMLSGDEWVAVKDAGYQSDYFDCLRQADRILNSKKSYEMILELSRRAVRIYPFEEWQLMEIDSLMHLNRYEEALRAYEDAVSRAYEELGVLPSPEMVERFRVMSKYINLPAHSIQDIYQLIEEKNIGNGPYYSAYPSFIDCFRLLKRMSERSGWTGSLLLCTLVNRDETPMVDQEMTQEAGDVLTRTLHHALRKGDLYTRFNPGQFLVLLSGAGRRECSVVTQRVNRIFQQDGSAKVRIRYDILEINGPSGEKRRRR